MAKKMRYYIVENNKTGVTALYTSMGDSFLERLFIPKVEINIVAGLPENTIEVIKKVYDNQVEKWDNYLMLSELPEPKKKEFIPVTKYLIENNLINIIGYSDKTVDELKAFFKQCFKDNNGIIIKDSLGEEIATITFVMLDLSTFSIDKIKL